MSSSYSRRSERDMVRIGLDIGVAAMDKKKLHERRIKKGECPLCGIKLFKVSGILGKKKVPLTVVGQVKNGRCLICNPVEQGTHLDRYDRTSSNNQMVVPRYLSVPVDEDDENNTVISGITVDPLVTTAFEDDSNNGKPVGRLRSKHGPGAGGGGNMEDSDHASRPQLPQRNLADSPREFHNIMQVPQEEVEGESTESSQVVLVETRPSSGVPSSHEESKEEIESPTQEQRHFYPPWQPQPTSDNSGGGMHNPTAGSNEIFFDSSGMCDLIEAEEQNPDSPAKSNKEIVVLPETLYMDRDDGAKKRPGKVPSPTPILSTKGAPKSATGSLGEGDIPRLLRSLTEGSNRESRISALRGLAAAIWQSTPHAKRTFAANKGIEKLTQTIWDAMSDGPVQEAAAELMLALAASADADPSSDILVGEVAQNAIDALLIVMQAFLHNEPIQQTGCRVLGCLAAASFDNPRVNDGSMSGGLLTVLNAMHSHEHSAAMQEWGVRTLYQQCTQSRNAESNKRALLSGQVGNGESTGALVVLKAMDAAPEDTMKLYWCLSSSEDVAEMLSPASDVINVIVSHVRRRQQTNNPDFLLEAAFATIDNLCRIEANRSGIDPNEMCILSLDTLEDYDGNIPLCTEICSLIATLATFPSIKKEEVAQINGIGRIAGSAVVDGDAETLQDEAVRAMLCLAVESDVIKAELRKLDNFTTFMRICRIREGSAEFQDLSCRLLATLFLKQTRAPTSIERDGLGAVIFAMTLHAESERVQEAACLALRNLSTGAENAALLLGSEAIDLATEAMRRFPHSKIVQTCVCHMYWNLGARLTSEEDSDDVIRCIVKAIQNHVDAADLLEVVFGALLTLIYGSAERKQTVADEGGIEAITCALVMHVTATTLLEKASEVLASLSALSDLVPSIVDAQGIPNIVETMRNNSSSTSMLRSGSLCLKNIIVTLPDSSESASGAITAVVNGMRSNLGDLGFQREACSFLWAISALSEDSKSKILALDGISVVMNTLEEYGNESDVQQAALGAFNELALAPSQVPAGT